jgi:HSP20 family protein
MLWTELGRFGRGFDPWFIEWPGDRPEGMMSEVSTGGSDFPLMNIWVNEDEAILTTEIPGIDPKAVEISVTGKTVSLRGRRQAEAAEDGKIVHRRERWAGQFSKAVELPFSVEADRVEARFTKGILSVRLPKAQAEKPRKITVRSE